MTQLFEALYQRVIPRDRLDASIGMNKIRAAIAHVRNRNLLPYDQRSRESCPTARRFLLNGTLRVTNGSLHDFLKRFLHRIWFYLEEERMKLLNNISGNTADRCIACHFPKLVAAH